MRALQKQVPTSINLASHFTKHTDITARMAADRLFTCDSLLLVMKQSDHGLCVPQHSTVKQHLYMSPVLDSIYQKQEYTLLTWHKLSKLRTVYELRKQLDHNRIPPCLTMTWSYIRGKHHKHTKRCEMTLLRVWYITFSIDIELFIILRIISCNKI